MGDATGNGCGSPFQSSSRLMGETWWDGDGPVPSGLKRNYDDFGDGLGTGVFWLDAWNFLGRGDKD